MPFSLAPCPFSLAPCPFSQRHDPFLKLHEMSYILVKKNRENMTKSKEVTIFFNLKPEVARKTDTCSYIILLSVNPFTMATNYLSQF